MNLENFGKLNYIKTDKIENDSVTDVSEIKSYQSIPKSDISDNNKPNDKIDNLSKSGNAVSNVNIIEASTNNSAITNTGRPIASLLNVKLTNEVKALVDKLPTDQKEKFMTLFNSKDQDGRSILSDNSKQSLINLLENCNLSKKDSGGKTILDNLNKIKNLVNNLESKVNVSFLLDDLIVGIDKPERSVQGYRNTCGAASLEYALMTKDPAEYTKIVADLATSGQSILRDGSTLIADNNSLSTAKDGDEGNRLYSSRIFQSAIMKAGTLFNQGGYNVNKDTPEAGLNAIFSGNAALNPVQQANILNRIEGGANYQFEISPTANTAYGMSLNNSGNKTDFNIRAVKNKIPALNQYIKKFIDDVNSGKPVTAMIATGGGSIHYVNVLRVENGQLVFKDPNGSGVHYPNDLKTRQLESPPNPSGTYSISLEDFKKFMMGFTG